MSIFQSFNTKRGNQSGFGGLTASVLVWAWMAVCVSAFVLMPSVAQAQGVHGISVVKGCDGPRLDGTAAPGETVSVFVRITNADTFGHSITLTSVVDIVHHTLGNTVSANLLSSNWVLTSLGSFIDVPTSFVVAATDVSPLVDTMTVLGIDNGTQLNTGGFAECGVIVVNPCIGVEKLVTCKPPTNNGTLSPAAVDPDCALAPGYSDTATGAKGATDPGFCYSITITNCGNVNLDTITVTDNVLGNLTASFPAALPVGTKYTAYFSASHNSTTINTVTANGAVVGSPSLTKSASDVATAIVVQASVTCTKRITSLDGGPIDTTSLSLLDNNDHNVTYTVTVTAGSVDLTNVVVTDPLLGPACDSLPAGPFNLAAGLATNFECTVSVNCTNLENGVVVNTVTVNAQLDPENTQGYCVYDGNGLPITVSSTCSATVRCTPAGCVTRSPGYWYNHATSTNPNCPTLLKAIQANGGSLNLGFMTLPVADRNANTILDADDALKEAEGFFWKNRSLTGDGKKASALCKARKQLAMQLIAALANRAMFGTNPGNCSIIDHKETIVFPSDLIEQAQDALACGDVNAIKSLITVLDQFNNSGEQNKFPVPFTTCPAKPVSGIAVDPTTKAICDNTSNCP